MKTSLSPVTRLALILAIFFSSVAAASPSASAVFLKTDTQQILDDLGGVPCFEGSAFTCITIEVPLDHFNSADTRTIPVVFAVLPASGARKGMFVTATGGPGTSGVLSADYYSSGFDASILESFDIVFFDQRGVGLLWRSDLSRGRHGVLPTRCQGPYPQTGKSPEENGQHLCDRLCQRIWQHRSLALSWHRAGRGRP